MQRREPAHVLQVERVHEQEAAEGSGQAHGDRARAGERGAGEEPHLEQRFAPAQLVEHQRGEAAQREASRITTRDGAEADSPALDDRVGERGQRRDHEHLAHRVDAPGSQRARLGHEPRGQRDRRQRDRQVDQEDGPPGDRRDENAAQHRPEGHRDAEHRREDTDRPRALAWILEHVAHDRHRHRAEHRPADRLQRRERRPAARGSAPARTAATPARTAPARPEHAAAPEAVRGRARTASTGSPAPACRRRRSTAGPTARSEASPDGRQRDIDDRHVQADDQQAHRADDEDEQAPPAVGHDLLVMEARGTHGPHRRI